MNDYFPLNNNRIYDEYDHIVTSHLEPIEEIKVEPLIKFIPITEMRGIPQPDYCVKDSLTLGAVPGQALVQQLNPGVR